MNTRTNQDLIRQAIAGDHGAFGALVDRYGAAVYARISRRVRDPDDVDDLVQDVFLTAYRRLDRIRDPDRFSAWINTVADNRVRQWYRRWYVQLRWEALLNGAGEEWRDEADDAAQMQELSRMLRQALRRLSEAHRQVIVHHYFRGYTYQETAGLLGIEVNTVRSRLQKARHRLRTEVQSMTGQTQEQRVALTRDDLRGLQWASSFVSRDPERLVLQGVYLDPSGRIIATDGHRMMIWTSDRLQKIIMPTLLGPWHGMDIPEGDRGTLSLWEQEGVIHVPGNPDRTVPILEAAKFPDYHRVIPTEWPIQVVAAAGDLQELVEFMAGYLDHLTPATPEDTTGHFVHRPRHPQVELRISFADQTLTLSTTRQMGYYSSAKEHRDETPPAGKPDWTFSASIPVQIKKHADEDRFRIWMDFRYLCDAVGAIHGSGDVLARFIEPLRPMLLSSMNEPDRQVLQMPLRMTPEERG